MLKKIKDLIYGKKHGCGHRDKSYAKLISGKIICRKCYQKSMRKQDK